MIHKNRSREANNQLAIDAFNRGNVCRSPREAYLWYMQAAKLGHDNAAYRAEKMLRILGMESNIDPKAYNRNLEETNKKIKKPKAAPSLSLNENSQPQQIQVLHSKKKENLNNKKKQRVSKTPTKEDKKKEFEKLKDKARKGDASSQYQCGMQYMEWAVMWLGKSAAQHNDKAVKQLDKITHSSTTLHEERIQTPTLNPGAYNTLRIWQASYAELLGNRLNLLADRYLYSGQTIPINAIRMEINLSEPKTTTMGSGQIDAEAGVLHLSYTSSPERTEITITLKELWKNICLYLRQNFAPFIAKNPRR